MQAVRVKLNPFGFLTASDRFMLRFPKFDIDMMTDWQLPEGSYNNNDARLQQLSYGISSNAMTAVECQLCYDSSGYDFA